MDSYEKILDTKIELRDTYDHFRTYSASDIKALIAANLKNKRTPAALVRLYKLESMIGELRTCLWAERDSAKAPAEPVAKAPAEPVAKDLSEPVAKALAEPVAKAPAEPVAKALAEPVAKDLSEPVAKALAEPKAPKPAHSDESK